MGQLEMAAAKTRRRKRVYVRHPPKTEMRAGFSIGSLTNLAVIPIVTALFTFGGFYYVTNGTLERYGADISRLNQAVTVKTNEDTTARNKIRDEFLASQMKTVEGIGKLDTRLAVAESNQKIANDQLAKIADSLSKISSMNRR